MDIVQDILDKELDRQRRGIELIASENFTSMNVMRTMGSCLTNKYAEGYPGKRYYGGCEHIDEMEQLAIDRVRRLFGCYRANVQPHSGAQANAAIFLAFLKPGDSILGFNLAHGGHLSHGSPVNFSGKYFNASFYGVERETGLIDMEKVREIAQQKRPKMIICGASSYSRDWDYIEFRKIADEVGAILLADISHPAGLIAKGLLNDPVPHCHVISSTTHKTLRGPRGGVILIPKNEKNPLGITNAKGLVRKINPMINSAVFPGMQGGPLEHIIAAKAVAFGEALRPEFKNYVEQVRSNARAMAKAFIEKGFDIISGGTDNHMMLIDLSSVAVTGAEAEHLLEKVDITINKNMVPFDKLPPQVSSGMRIGSAAVTTRGLNEEDCIRVVAWIDEAIRQRNNDTELKRIKTEVNEFQRSFPLYSEW